ncbi:hypothetical protein, partial [Bradyrhizobium sp.]|uniref:hypothetical protein n=1 Tax=Bradyrhizobium sp. TaxID=376 RepID=UPI003C260E6E
MFGDRPIRGIVDPTEGGLIAALGSKVDPFLPIRWIATVQLLVAVSGIISLRGIYEGLYLSTDFTIPILASLIVCSVFLAVSPRWAWHLKQFATVLQQRRAKPKIEKEEEENDKASLKWLGTLVANQALHLAIGGGLFVALLVIPFVEKVGGLLGSHAVKFSE